MADSDNTTTLPLVTGRTVAARTTNAMVGSRPTEFARKTLEEDKSDDPAVTVWREWQDAFKLTERLCREQQRLELELAETIGFPSGTILSNGESVTLHSLKEIRDLLGVDPIDAAVRAEAEANFAAHQARLDAADRAIGYSAAMLAEHEAANRAEALLEELSETPATTLAGVAAKLDAVLKEGPSSEHDAEFPWPQIRSAIEDIARISQQREPS
ncbi:hypothetical protein LJR234_004519 [Mesorhizobium amorphae]|uniref:hypothetical protein n=1 Tax=Mesorhizobium amorphae TaxID=71433 RepID=UPI003ECE3331